MQESTAFSPPDLNQLQTFELVARTLSFTDAARALQLDSSVIARRIAMLERRLGVRLFARTTRRMALTEAGQAYRARVQPALEELIDAAAEARERRHRASGLLRVSIPLGFGRRWITPLLPQFLREHPDVGLDVRFADRYVDLVDERFDLALRLGTLAESGLVARKIRDYTRGVYASPDYVARFGMPRSPLDLAGHRTLGFSGNERPSQWTLSNGRKRTVVSVPLRMISDDASCLVASASAGIGIVVATDWLVHDEVVDGRLIRLLPRYTIGQPGAAYVVMPSTRFVPGKTRAFTDWIVDAIRAMPSWGERPQKKPRR